LKSSAFFTSTGLEAGARLGYSVAALGDVDGNGYADIAAGAPSWDGFYTGEGAVFYFDTLLGYPNLYAIIEGDQQGEQLGTSVMPGGDLNGDGYADLVVGAPGYSNGEFAEGAALVYLGSLFGVGGTPPAAILEINQASAYFGTSVGTAGDVDGDGHADLLA